MRDIQNFVLKVVGLVFGNRWAKTGSALALLGAISLTSWLDQLVFQALNFRLQQTPTGVGLAIMFTGVALLVWGSRGATTQLQQQSAHDAVLIQSFRQLISNNTLDFLRHHRFDIPWRRDRLDGVAEIAETWRGARFEFEDVVLNEALERVKAAAKRLEEHIAYGTYPTRTNIDMQTVMNDVDDRLGVQPATLRKIADLNASAEALVAEIDRFERVARRT